MKDRNLLKYSYIGLTSILAICLTLFFIVKGNSDIKDFLLNLSTEVIGILLTVVLIDSVLRLKETREKQQLLKNSLIQLRPPINRCLHLILNMYKASKKEKTENLKSDFSELFTDKDFFDEIRNLDIFSNAPVTPKCDWVYHLDNELKFFKYSLEKTIEKYSHLLDSELIKLLEDIINSSFLSLFIQTLPTLIRTRINEGRPYKIDVFYNSEYGGLLPFCRLMLEFTEKYNKIMDDEKLMIKFDVGIWSDKISPRFGQSRIKNFA